MFKNDNVHKSHLTGKKHVRAAEARRERAAQGERNGDARHDHARTSLRLKERAVAEREYRAQRLAAAMQQQKSDTRVNVERRQGMTERERQTELDMLFADAAEGGSAMQGPDEDQSDSDGDEKIYNPLKLPLAWDGKPIPYWLYKLHGLGVELSCEICGNFVYMGRRAFDKHFNEARHIYGLKCLGITNTTLFREITKIEDALKLWDKIQRDVKKDRASTDNVVQMEDADGNVMPEKVYYEYVSLCPPHGSSADHLQSPKTRSPMKLNEAHGAARLVRVSYRTVHNCASHERKSVIPHRRPRHSRDVRLSPRSDTQTSPPHGVTTSLRRQHIPKSADVVRYHFAQRSRDSSISRSARRWAVTTWKVVIRS